MDFSFNYFIFFSSYSGYIDDVRNTDNAWVEAEIWNFHYGSTLSFPHLPTDVLPITSLIVHFSSLLFRLGNSFMEKCHS